MGGQNSMAAKVKQHLKHDLRNFPWVFGYLVLYLFVLATYSMLLLNKFDVKFFAYGAVLGNAWLLSHAILWGQSAHLGKKSENKPIIVSAIFKAFLFSLFAAVLHVTEETVHGALHGHSWTTALYSLRLDEVLMRNVVVFAGLIMFFAFWEMRRVLGEERFSDLLFRVR